MSIYVKFDVGPKGRRLRRAVDQDKVDIERFRRKEETETLFCDDNFGRLIELCTLSIVMIDENQDVTGFLALSDHPPLPGVDPSSWEVWVRNMFRKYYLSFNTLFIHFTCCMDSVAGYFLEEAFHAVFMNDFYLQQIILVVPPTCKVDCLSKYPCFKRRSIFRHCVSSGEEETCVSLYVAQRSEFCPKLKVRRAVEEDNDDVVVILDKHCKELKELYGDYYVSEIISRHPEIDRKVIVAEVNLKNQDKQKLVGVMCLNSEINYEKLQRTYELTAYHGLLKVDRMEREELKTKNTLLKTFGDPIMTGQLSPFDDMGKKNRRRIDTSPSKIDMLKDRQTAVRQKSVNFKQRIRRSTFRRQSSKFSRGSNDMEKLFSQSLAAEMSLMFLIDDEPLDYEIVNIDTGLLTVPEASSMDTITRKSISQNISEHRLKRKRSSSRTEDTGLVFQGKPDAFVIEIFALDDDIDDRQAFDMLEAAFECMPQYDYCIIRIPSAKKSFGLLHHFTFVPTNPKICCKYALYVAHRNSVLGKLRVRQAEIADIPQIATLLHNVDGKETIWTIEHAIQSHHHHLAYVFLSGYTIIGFGVLDPPEHTDLVRTRFNVEEYQYTKYHISGEGLEGGVSMIKTVLAYPAFEPHYSFFARDLMRMSGSSSLMWLTAYRNKWVAHKANAIVTAMTPLSYRTRSTSGLSPELKELHALAKNMLSFSAWLVSKKLTSIPKLNVDSRIVIVGASRTAMSFIYHLLFGDSSTYLTFTNVTLVSTNGLPYMRHLLHAAELMFPKHDNTSDRFLKSTPFSYYVNVVSHTMAEIDKQEKCIITEYGYRYYYDQLFLFVGKQYQHPGYLKSLRNRERNMQQGKTPTYVRMDDPAFTVFEPFLDYDTPENVFLVNNIYDANRALNYIRSFFWRLDDCYNVIVYGADINAYCCITALLDMEVTPDHIIFIEPFPPDDDSKPRVPFFCNHKVDQSVQTILDSLGIKIYRGYHFENWEVDEYNKVQCVDLISHYNYLRLECAAFFYYGKKFVDPSAFVAIKKSGIAYNGGILIDHNMQTNDPSIYAAGPCTRYYSRYNAEKMQQKFYSSDDIGRKLAIQIRNQLDPLLIEKKKDQWVHPELNRSRSFESCRCYKDSSSDSTCTCSEYSAESDRTCYQGLIPKLDKPLVWHCVLPGKLQYLEVRPPGVKFPHYYVQSLHYNVLIPKLDKPLVWHCILPGKLQYLEVRPPGVKFPHYYVQSLHYNPLVRHCLLPGKLQYLEVRPPGVKFPHYYVQSLHYNGTVLETFETGYFKLHFNKDLIVDGITCLTPDTESVANFKMLYGKSTVALNNVLLRFSTGGIDDLYKFFRKQWCVYLYHERSEELMAVAKHLKPKCCPDGKTLEDALREVSDIFKHTEVSEGSHVEVINKLRTNFDKNVQSITDYVIEWLTDNDLIQPLYVTPSNLIAADKNVQSIADYVIEWLTDNDLIQPLYVTPSNLIAADKNVQSITDYVIEWLTDNDLIQPLYVTPSNLIAADKNVQSITDYVIEWLTDNDLIQPLYVTPSNLIAADKNVQSITDYVIEWLTDNDLIQPLYVTPSNLIAADKNVQSITDYVIEWLTDNDLIQPLYVTPSNLIAADKNVQSITDYVIEWLTDNDLIQSLYVTPSNLIEFNHDILQNPAFRRRKRAVKTMLAMIA
ncbi:cilia- and flagella-associated protein 61 [Phthorimaea operculella]|nr:cilia- and flagella-associated protein 61 [Phthorimaea operculella]